MATSIQNLINLCNCICENKPTWLSYIYYIDNKFIKSRMPISEQIGTYIYFRKVTGVSNYEPTRLTSCKQVSYFDEVLTVKAVLVTDNDIDGITPCVLNLLTRCYDCIQTVKVNTDKKEIILGEMQHFKGERNNEDAQALFTNISMGIASFDFEITGMININKNCECDPCNVPNKQDLYPTWL